MAALRQTKRESLEARLRKGPIPIEEALQIAIQIASALDAAHRRGMVHRDLKPGNAMLTRGGTKLLDFGLAKMNEPAALSDMDVTQLAPHRPIIEHYRLSPGAPRPGSTKTTSQQISRIF
jgi:serine/threonine protein kinase